MEKGIANFGIWLNHRPMRLILLGVLFTFAQCVVTEPELQNQVNPEAATDNTTTTLTLAAAAAAAASGGPVLGVNPVSITYNPGGCGPVLNTTVTVTNSGSGTLVLTTPFALTYTPVGGATNVNPFTVFSPGSTSIAAGGSTTFIARFTSSGGGQSGNYTGTITVVSNVGTIVIDLTGFTPC